MTVVRVAVTVSESPIRVYRNYFGFTEDPFGITPDPRFFYENPIYRDAYATLASGVSVRRGLMTLVGAVGTGKTTVLRRLMASSKPGVQCVLADYPPPSFDELLTFTCREVGVRTSEPRGRLDWIGALKEALLASHAENGTTALLLDEAQHLTEETLQGVRLLSNLETAGDKLLQIVLAGQPELCAKIDQPSLASLKQRITFECRLDRLSYGEIAAYIEHRLSVAGYRGPELFGPDAVEAIGFYSGGVPRLVNVICGNALVAAHRASRRSVSSNLVVEAARALRIGPAFEYTASRPGGSEGPAASQTDPAPDRIWHDPPSIRSRGGLSSARGVARQLRARSADRRAVMRRCLSAARGVARQLRARSADRRAVMRRCLLALVGCLAFVLGGSAGLALWPIVRAMTPGPLAATPAAGPAEHIGPQDTIAVQAPEERAAMMPRPPASEDAPPATPELAGPLAAEAPAEPADGRETRMAAAGEAITPRAGSAGATAESGEDAAERGPAPRRSPRPTQQVVLQPGATIFGFTRNAFGPRMFLALDLVKELNPHLDDLNRVLAGQSLRLPRLGRDDLMRASRDGSHRLILNSFPNPAHARALGEIVRARGFNVMVTSRQISDDLVLSRVEISGLRDRPAADRAWETALAAGWLSRVADAGPLSGSLPTVADHRAAPGGDQNPTAVLSAKLAQQPEAGRPALTPETRTSTPPEPEPASPPAVAPAPPHSLPEPARQNGPGESRLHELGSLPAPAAPGRDEEPARRPERPLVRGAPPAGSPGGAATLLSGTGWAPLGAATDSRQTPAGAWLSPGVSDR